MTGEYLTNAIPGELGKNGLDIQNCRAQGNDNEANMVGIISGVKTRILNINPKSFCTPCGYDLPKDFKNKRVAKKERMFDYEGGDPPIICPKPL
ncbi:hypothetical protein TNCV_3226101 [Trichonephila clavipes]|nr:hypothetical protein TNCV_3226101 [Trichonephila clavipes]